MNKNYTLDSFALLSWFQDEKGAGVVENLIKMANRKTSKLWISVINLGEIYYITFRERGEVLAKHALSIIDNLPIEIVPANKEMAIKAAEIKAIYPVSYADAFSAALGIITGSHVVTGDPEFKNLEEKVKVEWLER